MMRHLHGGRPLTRSLFATATAVLAAAVLVLAPGASLAATKFTRVTTLGVGTSPNFAMVRTTDGKLHLLYQTAVPGPAPTGLATRSISPAGVLGAQVPALAWGTSRPGLTLLPNGDLLSVFGAISPAPHQVSTLWGIESSNGGATWSAPTQVASGSTLEALAYGGDVTAQVLGSTPVFTINAAGGLVVQQGLGSGSPTHQITSSAHNDDFAGDVDSAVDASTGQVVASWNSLAGSGGDFLQTVAPTSGSPVKSPGELRNELVIAGRDTGSGVFGAYTTDGTHVRLLRFGGGSVAVGKLNGLTAEALGVATGLDGRIWVMWGQDGLGIAVTRSNKAVTRFEPIQHLNPGSFTLYRLSGDGRLGPLDLFVDQIPTGKTSIPPAGTFYGRVLPELSATVSLKNVKNKAGKVTAHKLTVKVTDAGDPVAGATVSVKGKQVKTGSTGIGKLTLPASAHGSVKVSITDAGYQKLSKKVKL